MRKLTTVIGLVLVLALGLVAGVGRSQPAQAVSGDSVVLAWNQQLLDTFKETRTGPSVAARALAVVHSAIYDAWAAYDPVAVGTRMGGNLRQPAAERTVDNKTRAVSFAAYATLVDLFPARQGIYSQQMTDLGMWSTGPTPPRRPWSVGLRPRRCWTSATATAPTSSPTNPAARPGWPIPTTPGIGP